MRKRSRIPEYNACKKDTALFVMRPTSAVPVQSSGGKGREREGGRKQSSGGSLLIALRISKYPVHRYLED